MSKSPSETLFGDGFSLDRYSETVLAAANRGAQIAIETHRRMGRSIVVWQGGQIVQIPPEQIAPRDLNPPAVVFSPRNSP